MNLQNVLDIWNTLLIVMIFLWGGVKRIYFIKKLSRLRAITGIELNPNCAGPGIHISHGKIVVGSIAKLGKNCKILSDVTIGGQGRYDRWSSANRR